MKLEMRLEEWSGKRISGRGTSTCKGPVVKKRYCKERARKTEVDMQCAQVKGGKMRLKRRDQSM